MPRKSRSQPRAEEGLPPWMATFADMVTLLLCFFVLLLSFAKHDVEKFRTLMGSIRDAFGVQVEREEDVFAAFAPSPNEAAMDEVRRNKQITDIMRTIATLVRQDSQLRHSTTLDQDDLGVNIRVQTAYLFQPGSARLTPESIKVLTKVTEIMNKYNYNCVIRGHTDDLDVQTSAFASNWELSSARAVTVLRALVERGGISPLRLKAIGFADSRPIVPNNSDENRIQNRRIEFYIHLPSDDF